MYLKANYNTNVCIYIWGVWVTNWLRSLPLSKCLTPLTWFHSPRVLRSLDTYLRPTFSTVTSLQLTMLSYLSKFGSRDITAEILKVNKSQTTCMDKNTIWRARNNTMKLEIHFLSNDQTILTPRKVLQVIQRSSDW